MKYVVDITESALKDMDDIYYHSDNTVVVTDVLYSASDLESRLGNRHGS